MLLEMLQFGFFLVDLIYQLNVKSSCIRLCDSQHVCLVSMC